MKHKHNWIHLLPYTDKVADKVGYFLETRVFSRLDNILVCTVCGATGHRIKSVRGGVRKHNSDYFLKKAIELSRRHNLKLNYETQTSNAPIE